MYELNDTIVAVSSATADKQVIIRITGTGTIDKVNLFFKPEIEQNQHGIFEGKLSVDNEITIEATVYVFTGGQSYTGEDLAEIHIWSNQAVTEAIINSILQNGVRMAGPGEFTARAYMNGKLDLAQAEAVNKVVTSSNRLQLEAAQKLLSGRLTKTVEQVSSELMDCLSRIEAGMDFSAEDIEFISTEEAEEQLESIKEQLEKLIKGSISYEMLTDMPTVGIAGAVNAGKSSLLNALLGRQRSIVSSEQKTTRDILTGILELERNRCVVFDCAGLITEMHNQIDELAQAAAIEALNSADAVIICVDITKEDLTEDVKIRGLIKPGAIISVATKSDLLIEDEIQKRFVDLAKKFKSEFISVSSKNGDGTKRLKEIINKRLSEQAGTGEAQNASVLLTARHKQSVCEAVDNIEQATSELRAENNEIAAMMIRGAYLALSKMETEHIDEKILDNIFSEFCIGK